MTTIFVLSSAGWLDDDLPLQHRFSWRPAGNRSENAVAPSARGRALEKRISSDSPSALIRCRRWDAIGVGGTFIVM